MSAVLGLCWAGLVLAAARRRAPRGRLSLLRHSAHAPARPRPPWLSSRHRRLAWALVAALFVAALVPPAAPLAAAAAWMAPTVGARRRQQRRLAALADDLPDIIDLLLLAAGAGHTVPLALRAVAHHASGPLAGELHQALAESERGSALADALDRLPARAGDATRPLAAVLTASLRYGAPLASSLERLATDARAERARRAEAAARRVPVRLIFPLVLCILPAFALLTVAPLIAGALQALRL